MSAPQRRVCTLKDNTKRRSLLVHYARRATTTTITTKSSRNFEDKLEVFRLEICARISNLTSLIGDIKSKLDNIQGPETVAGASYLKDIRIRRIEKCYCLIFLPDMVMAGQIAPLKSFHGKINSMAEGSFGGPGLQNKMVATQGSVKTLHLPSSKELPIDLFEAARCYHSM